MPNRWRAERTTGYLVSVRYRPSHLSSTTEIGEIKASKFKRSWKWLPLHLFRKYVEFTFDYYVLRTNVFNPSSKHTLFLPHLHLNMFKVKMQNPPANIDHNVAGGIIQVIGAGLPRTGTTSLVAAMEILGFGPSFHFTEVFYNPGYAPIFERLLLALRITGSRFAPKSKEESDVMKNQLKDIFRGYNSTLDTPGCLFVPELMELYPHAKVLLSVRDSDEAWHKSVQGTLSVMGKRWYMLLTLPMGLKPILDLGGQCFNVIEQYSRGNSRKENHSLHNQWIREIVPKENLLEVCIFSYRLVYKSVRFN